MTKRRWISSVLPLLLACAIAPIALAQDTDTAEEDERIVRSNPVVCIFDQGIDIQANVEQRAPVVAIGCDATIKGEVDDNVVVVFGELDMDGADVGENVVGVFSEMRIRDSYIDNTLVNALGSLDHDGGFASTVNIGLPFGWAPQMRTVLFWFRMVGLLLVFIALIAAVSIAPERVEVISREAPVRYFSAFFVGLLGYLALLILLTLLMATVIGLPAGILFFKILKWVGVAGIFLALGRRIGRALGREMSPLAAVLLSFGLYAAFVILMSWIGVVGILVLGLFRLFFWLMFEVPAVGLVILTRFGTSGGMSPAFAGAGAASTVVTPPPPTEPVVEPVEPAPAADREPEDRI